MNSSERHVWETPHLQHEFEPKRFNSPTNCENCGKLIIGLIGKQGLKCENCSFISHKKCADKCAHTCPFNYIGNYNEHKFLLTTYSSPTFCNICRRLLAGVAKQGLECIICGFKSHEECTIAAFKNCPTGTVPEDSVHDKWGHQWLEGNLKGSCSVCKSTMKSTSHLWGARCFWCRVKVCSYKCQKVLPYDCIPTVDVESLIPPTSVHTDGDPTNKDNLRIDPLDNSPLIAFVNTKSGGGLGPLFEKEFCKLLNPVQVVDLIQDGPDSTINMLMRNNIYDYKIVAAGGDGTAAWLFAAYDKHDIPSEEQPPLAILPLGTGNDLSRTLGWGNGCDSAEDATKFMSRIPLTSTMGLDRWKINQFSVDENGEYSVKVPNGKLVANNYFSVGVDAEIALKFHNERETNPDAFTSRVGNYLKYAKHGASAAMQGYPDLSKSITLEVDGEYVHLQPLRALVVVNLPSCYGGCYLWGSDDELEGNLQPMRIDDGLVEIVGITSASHLGKIQAGVSSPFRIAQGSDVKITLSKPLPCQVDGEPAKWEPCRIHISLENQVRVLYDTAKCHPSLNE
eukprot:TRINITY_DN4116_c0_g2_i1.p1 TRINITY_DN4116_c0_g2~~TRINITY_DN4116_c0_g2_i1.p1  ORF type:complete len:566 (-),score=121.84 TRINITY_DN4116_c0_g2_i1:18-1715(-)